MVDTFEGLSEKHFFRVRSLQQIAAINIVGNIYIAADEDANLNEKINQLKLPKSLSAILKQLVGPVTHSIQIWKKLTYFPFTSVASSDILRKYGVRYKWCGTVDFEGMAKLVVCEEVLPIGMRVSWACRYSLRDEIYKLWPKLAEEDKINLSHGTSLFWKQKMEGVDGGTDPDTAFRYGMSAALQSCNFSSVDYYWQQMSDSKKAQHLFGYASEVLGRAITFCSHPEDLLPFFLLKMNKQQQIDLACNELKVNHPYCCSNLLLVLLRWPWQDLFIPMLTLVSNSITEQSIRETFQNALLELLFESAKMFNRSPPFAAEANFEHIWSLLTEQQKHCVRTNSDLMLEPIAGSGSHHCLDVILAGVDTGKRKDIAMSDECIMSSYFWVKCERYDRLELFISHYLPKNEMTLSLFENKLVQFASSEIESFCSELEDETNEETLNMRKERHHFPFDWSDFGTKLIKLRPIFAKHLSNCN